MTRAVRALLIVEAFICFGPLAALLLVGAVMVPLQIHAITSEPLLWEGPAALIASVMAGLVGLCTLMFVLSTLLGAGRPFGRPMRVLLGVLIGAAPVLHAAFSGEGPMLIVVLLPLASTVHILYLSRRLFLPAFRDPDRRWGHRHALAIDIACLLAALGLMQVERIDLSHDELLQKRAAWMAHRPIAYSFHIHIAGWVEPNLLLPRRVVVSGDRVISATYDLGPYPPSGPIPPPEQQAWSMDILFDELLEASESGARVRARFNERWSYVEKAFVDYGAEMSGWSLELKEFDTSSE